MFKTFVSLLSRHASYRVFHDLWTLL